MTKKKANKWAGNEIENNRERKTVNNMKKKMGKNEIGLNEQQETIAMAQ